MKLYAAFVRANRAPLLVREGFSVWAFLFGPLWLLVHAAWIPAVLLFVVEVLLRTAVHGPASVIVGFGVAWLVGLQAQDMRGWSLRRRGWRLAHVVAARSHDGAYARLLSGHPAYQDAAAL